MKACSRCKSVKSADGFSPDKSMSSGLKSICKVCAAAQQREWKVKNPEKAKANCLAWYYRNRDRANTFNQKRKRLTKYGVCDTAYQAMLSLQQGACAVCRTAFSATVLASIDHDHATGKVRGLLCKHCNLAEGQFAKVGDPIAVARALVAYLENPPALATGLDLL